MAELPEQLFAAAHAIALDFSRCFIWGEPSNFNFVGTNRTVIDYRFLPPFDTDGCAGLRNTD